MYGKFSLDLRSKKVLQSISHKNSVDCFLYGGNIDLKSMRKKVHIQSYSGPHFSHSDWIRKDTDHFHAVNGFKPPETNKFVIFSINLTRLT